MSTNLVFPCGFGLPEKTNTLFVVCLEAAHSKSWTKMHLYQRIRPTR